MSFGGLHREDVKALLRKRHGTVAAFEARRSLAKDAVSDLLRGRTSAKTAKALQDEIDKARSEEDEQSDKSDDSTSDRPIHRLTAEAV